MKRLLKHWPFAVASVIAFNGRALDGLVFAQDLFRAPTWYCLCLWFTVIYGGLVVVGYPRARKYWPAWVAIISFGLNTDLMIIHFQTRFRLNQQELLEAFGLIGGLGIVRMLYTYWFLGWAARMIKNTDLIQDSITFGEKINLDLRKDGYVDRIKRFVERRLDLEHYQDSKLLKRIKAGGYPLMFFLGFVPVSGTRNTAILASRLTNYFGGLCALIVGATLRTGYLLGGIQLLKSLFQ